MNRTTPHVGRMLKSDGLSLGWLPRRCRVASGDGTLLWTCTDAAF